MEHSQLQSLWVDMPDRKTAFVSRAHVGKANITMTSGHDGQMNLVNMLLGFKDPLRSSPLICRSRTSERVTT